MALATCSAIETCFAARMACRKASESCFHLGIWCLSLLFMLAPGRIEYEAEAAAGIEEDEGGVGWYFRAELPLDFVPRKPCNSVPSMRCLEES